MVGAPRLLATVAVVAIAIGSVTVAARPAAAHVDPEPSVAQAGSLLVVGFTVQHGCSGSPTVRLDMRLPDAVTDAEPEAIEGWVSSIEAGVVSFSGGRLADDKPLTFTVLMRLPPAPDTTVYFPFVQRCEVGEIRWIQTPDNSANVTLDEPAPAMRLVGPVAEQPVITSTTTDTSIPSSVAVAPSATLAATSTTAATVEPVTSVPVTSSPSQTETSKQRNGRSGTLLFAGLLAALAVIGYLAARQAKRGRR